MLEPGSGTGEIEVPGLMITVEPTQVGGIAVNESTGLGCTVTTVYAVSMQFLFVTAIMLTEYIPGPGNENVGEGGADTVPEPKFHSRFAMLVLLTEVTVEELTNVYVVSHGGGTTELNAAVGLGWTNTTATEDEGQFRLLIRFSVTVYVPTLL